MARQLSDIWAWPQLGLMLFVRAYRLLLKPWLGNACRFEPTCSAYALEALDRHGALRGSALSSWRLLRCHPWCDGGHDPVPENLSRLSMRSAAGLFTRFSPVTQAPPPPERPGAPSPTRKTP